MDEVRVKIESSTVSATDIFIRKGIYPLLKKKPPFTLGYDFVGIIDEIGLNVSDYKVGNRVCGIVMIGGNAKYIICKQAELTLVPEDIDATLAACLTLSGITAYQMFLHYAGVNDRARILIHGGSGAIGDTLLQLGKLYRCRMVTTASVKKHAYIKKTHGALTFDYRAKDYWDDIKLLAGNGFDAVFDFTNQKSFNNGFHLLKKGGTIVTYGVFTSSLKIQKKSFWNFLAFGMDFGIMRMKLFFWNLLPNGKRAVFYGSTDSRKEFTERHRLDMMDLYDLVRKGLLKPLVHTNFPLEDVSKAHELLQSGEVHGQIVIENSV